MHTKTKISDEIIYNLLLEKNKHFESSHVVVIFNETPPSAGQCQNYRIGSSPTVLDKKKKQNIVYALIKIHVTAR